MAETWLKDTQKGSGETTITNSVGSLLASQQINSVERKNVYSLDIHRFAEVLLHEEGKFEII